MEYLVWNLNAGVTFMHVYVHNNSHEFTFAIGFTFTLKSLFNQWNPPLQFELKGEVWRWHDNKVYSNKGKYI